jgi:hypothetical protein
MLLNDLQVQVGNEARSPWDFQVAIRKRWIPGQQIFLPAH